MELAGPCEKQCQNFAHITAKDTYIYNYNRTRDNCQEQQRENMSTFISSVVPIRIEQCYTGLILPKENTKSTYEYDIMSK